MYGIPAALAIRAAIAVILFACRTCYDPQSLPGLPSRNRFMRRRLAIIALLLLTAGCSSKAKSSRPTLRSLGPASRAKRPKGPKTMGNLLVNAYVDDLKKGPPQKKIAAAQQLAAMGPNAKAAVPALESLAADSDATVSAAAKQALKAIKK